MNPLRFINATITLPGLGCKARFDQLFFRLPPSIASLRSPTSAETAAMQQVPPDIWATLERRFDEAQLPAPQRPECRK